jgi:hypothetical protein
VGDVCGDQKAKVVLEAKVVVGTSMQQIEKQLRGRICGRIVRPQTRQFLSPDPPAELV